MSLPQDRWTVYTSARMSKIDAELKEKLSPFGASRSARFRFAYDLAFAIVCGDCTNAMVAAILGVYQETKCVTFSHKVPLPICTADKEGVELKVGDSAPFHIKGFQGGTRWDLEALLQRATGVH